MKCLYRDKPGGMETCFLLAQDGSKFCPRHTFLHNLDQQERHEKELAAHDKKANAGAPADRGGMLTRGYVYTGNRDCRECHKPIEWWKTPAGKMAPYDPMAIETSRAVSHFATCVHAAHFRRAG